MTSNKFSGFLSPLENWSKLPHQFIDALPLIETISEMKIILYILRHTWGYHDTEKKITVDEFCNGRKNKNGGRIDGGTGLSTNAVKDGISRAIEHGFINVCVDDSDLARIKKYYRLSELGGQTLTPRPSNFDPRSEKETKEIKNTTTSSNVFKAYESEIGFLSPVIAQQIESAIGDYSEQLVIDAIKQASIQNKRKWSYINGILIKWKADGKGKRNGNGSTIILRTTQNPDGSYNI